MSKILPLTAADTFKDATPSTPSDCVNSSNIDEGALVSDPIDHDSLADDISYTPSECSDDPESEDEDEPEWTKEKMKPSLYSININGVDSKIEEKFQQETKQLKKNIIGEFKAVGGTLPG